LITPPTSKTNVLKLEKQMVFEAIAAQY